MTNIYFLQRKSLYQIFNESHRGTPATAAASTEKCSWNYFNNSITDCFIAVSYPTTEKSIQTRCHSHMWFFWCGLTLLPTSCTLSLGQHADSHFFNCAHILLLFVLLCFPIFLPEEQNYCCLGCRLHSRDAKLTGLQLDHINVKSAGTSCAVSCVHGDHRDTITMEIRGIILKEKKKTALRRREDGSND